MTKPVIEFGTIVIDRLHQFFGSPDPIACVVIDPWSKEEDDDETWVDHYRGRFAVKFSDLRNPDRWEVLDQKVDTSKNVLDQLKAVAEEYRNQNAIGVDIKERKYFW